MAVFVPTGTYGPTKVVEPLEKDELITYTDKNGNDYIAVGVDFEKEDWFNRLIESEGLENLCQQYPYQPLKVDKETGLLVPINPCDYNAKLTNGFHVIYQMRKEQMEQNPSYTFSKPDASSTTHTYGFNVEIEEGLSQIPEYSPKWHTAYHLNEEPLPPLNIPFHEIWVEKPSDRYGFTNNGGSFLPEEDLDSIQPDHPNHFLPPRQQQPQNTGFYGQYQEPGFQNLRNAIHQFNQQQEIQYYNPNYLPSYNAEYLASINKAHATGGFSPTFDLLGEESRRAMEREEANMRYATQISQATTNRVDFADPNTLSSLQEPHYQDPSVLNMNNPNRTKPIPTLGYDMNVVKQHINPSYFYHNFQNNPNYNPSNTFGGTPQITYGYTSNRLSYNYVEFSEVEKRNGKDLRVRVVRGSQEVEVKQTKIITRQTIEEESRRFRQKLASSVRVVRVHEVNVNGTIVEMNDEEYQKFVDKTDDNLDIGEPTEGRKRYGQSFINGVIELGKQMYVYERAWTQVLIESMDDINYSTNDMKDFIQVTKKKLQWYRDQERIHKERNYRVDYRYRRTPTPIRGLTGLIMFSPEDRKNQEYQERRKFALVDGKVIDFYRYDRGREPNEEEWDRFCAEVEYVRDVEVQLFRSQELVRLEERNLDLQETYSPIVTRSLNDYKYRQKHAEDQYSIYRAIYGTSLSDEDFDKWWYRYDDSHKETKTEEDEIFAREHQRYQVGYAHQEKLASSMPLDYEKITIAVQQKRAKIIQEFDDGIMDDCGTLMDFFDRLHYLVGKCSDETVNQQKEEYLRTVVYEDKDAYNRILYQWANSPQLGDNRNPNFPYDTFEQFMDSDEYKRRKEMFIHYCDTNRQHIPLKPVFK